MSIFRLILLYLLCGLVVTKADVINLTNADRNTLNITSSVLFAETDAQNTPHNSSRGPINYKKIDSDQFVKSYTTQKLWFEFTLKNSDSGPLKKVLVFDTSLSGELSFYEKTHDGKFIFIEKSGSSLPAIQKELKSLKAAFAIDLRPDEEKTFVITRESLHQLDVKFLIKTYEKFLADDFEQKVLLTFYAGVVVALFVYNIFLYFHSKSNDYLRYCIFISCIAATVLNINGVLDLFIFSDTESASKFLMAFSSASVVAILFFSYYFLRLFELNSLWKKFYTTIGVVAILHAIIRLFPFDTKLQTITGISIDITILFTILTVIISGIFSLRKGHVLAKYFLISWTFFFAGVLIWLGIYYGPIPKNLYTNNAILIGNIFEMLIIAFALSYKLNILERQKRDAEIQAKDKERYQRLVRVLCHDIGNSLFIIQGFTKNALKRPELINQKATWQKIHKATQNMSSILKTVREQENAVLSQDQISLGPVCLNSLLEETLFYFNDKCKTKNLTLQMNLDKSIQLIRSEKTSLLNNVLNNIISNAIKFSHSRSTIFVKTYQKDQQIFCEIMDQGVGIPREKIRSLIDGHFIQSTQGTHGEHGTGYGLTLIRDYMKIYGGDFEIQSTTAQDKNGQSGTKIVLTFCAAKEKFPIEKNLEGL